MNKASRSVIEFRKRANSPEAQIESLRRAYDETFGPDFWARELSFSQKQHLLRMAPECPEGHLAFRSLRIRFGGGDDGVALTFEAHVARIRAVLGWKHFNRELDLRSGWYPVHGRLVERLRLFNGNHTHGASLEWVLIDLDANRERSSVTAVRGPKSLADELLVFAWMFPDCLMAINFETTSGMFAAGYEANIPGVSGKADPWRFVPRLGWQLLDASCVELCCHVKEEKSAEFSVPILLE